MKEKKKGFKREFESSEKRIEEKRNESKEEKIDIDSYLSAEFVQLTDDRLIILNSD